MRKIMSLGLVALTGIVNAADDQPLLFPTRDVIVQFTARVGDIIQETQMSYLASEQKIRSITKGYEIYTLIDERAHTMIVVYPGSPPTYVMNQYPGKVDIKYRRTSQKERIAGYDCDVWSAPPIVRESPAIGFPTYSQSSIICVTTDGITLRNIVDQNVQGNRSKVIMEATKVTYGALNPALFRIPTGAIRSELPR